MPEEVTRQTVLYSKLCGHGDKGWVPPRGWFCLGDGVLATQLKCKVGCCDFLSQRGVSRDQSTKSSW